jgi:hypothetical protein
MGRGAYCGMICLVLANARDEVKNEHIPVYTSSCAQTSISNALTSVDIENAYTTVLSALGSHGDEVSHTSSECLEEGKVR